eukprot:jgi/Tetstr1/447131/TSEL_034569.t1
MCSGVSLKVLLDIRDIVLRELGPDATIKQVAGDIVKLATMPLERRMTELVRSWDDARAEAFYAGHARQRRTDADLFAALLVGTADTVVALVEDGELSRAAGRLSSKGMGDLSDPATLAQLRDKHPSHSHPIPDAAYDIPVDEAALTVDMRVPY